MEKIYQPALIEEHWYQIWEQKNYFAPEKEGTPYCIILPPPNVTGSLHMGHGFGFTLIDICIRFQRMQGKKVLWQGGTDHAGIATQMVVERQLNAQGKKRQTMGREAFVAQIWEWKQHSGNRIEQQLKRLGASIDWQQTRFTLDDDLSKTVRDVFIQFYEEGLIYRGNKLVNWDPTLLTAISDLEVINEEVAGFLWYIRYPIENSRDFITVATTRPETLLGDQAVCVHPHDTRYQHLHNKKLQVPLTNRFIPIITDESIDQAFGTGAVKITPAHDFNDYELGKRHQLEPLTIFTKEAKLNDKVPKRFQGLDRFKAREEILYELEKENLLEKTLPHSLNIPRGDRSGSIIEPLLTPQWFMNMKPLAEEVLAKATKENLQFIPENYRNQFLQWLNNIQDWCLSRQLWWGHRLPIWYGEKENEIYIGENEAAVREKYQLGNKVLKQDEDVLDTWFSAALWPFTSLGWPHNQDNFKTFYPTNLLITGFDIIFFWVARMVMFGLKLTGSFPFAEVFITGLIRDTNGQKMSKTKGNVIDPLDVIDGISLENLITKRTQGLMQPAMLEKIRKETEKQFPKGISAYGTDALRFTFCALATHNREIRFDLNRLTGYRNFCNKLWNLSRYTFMQLENKSLVHITTPTHLINQFILSRLQSCIQAAQLSLKEYRFDLLAQHLYEFVWNEFCDWHIEFSKTLLAANEEDLASETRYILVYVLEQILRLLHPIMPFITEEIWQRLPVSIKTNKNTIMLAPYPKEEPQFYYREVENIVLFIKTFIISLRTLRSENNIAPSCKINVYLRNTALAQEKIIMNNLAIVKTLAKVNDIYFLSLTDTAPSAATLLFGEIEILIPLEDMINIHEEKARLKKEIDKLTKEQQFVKTKLDNPLFIAKAPSAVITKEKEKLIELENNLQKLKEKINAWK